VAERLAKAFEAKYPGIAVRVERTRRPSACSSVSARNTPVAFILSTSSTRPTPPTSSCGNREGLPSPYGEDVAKYYPAGTKIPTAPSRAIGAWVCVIGYNTNMVKAEEAPKELFRPARSEMDEQDRQAHPSYSGHIMTATYQMARDLGWDYFEKLAKQKGDAGAVVGRPAEELSLGERAVMARQRVQHCHREGEGKPGRDRL